LKCKSIIEIEKELRKEKHEKKRDILSRLVTPTGTKGCPATWALAASFVPVARPGTKRHPLFSRTGVPSWETGTTVVSQPGQINVFVVVRLD